MIYVTPEEIRNAKEPDLLSYLQAAAPQELVHLSGDNYCTREHDSLKISNGKWHWFSRGIGGRSALDYLIKVKNVPFPEAVQMVLAKSAIEPLPKVPRKREQHLLLPEPVKEYPSKVVRYLEGRGIDREIIDYCIDRKLLFESAEYHNAVFVGYDRDGVARYAALRGIYGAYKAEAAGSSKHSSFSICENPEAAILHVFESAVDLLSFLTLEKQAGGDWRKEAFLSLAGVFMQKRENVVPVALMQFFKDHSSIRSILLHLDNDAVGRSAAKGILQCLAGKSYDLYDLPPKYGKDVNEQLQILKKKELLSELLSPAYDSLWNSLIYGTASSNDIVEVALSQLGNTGEPYWTYMGFESRVEWCACFVSWCANECGYIEAGLLPNTAGCVVGETWFRQRDRWQDSSYIPNPGDIIYFDWDDARTGGQDGVTDHVGIVEKVEDGYVYTVEGNSNDLVKSRSYPIDSNEIYGYGVPDYASSP